MAEMDWVDVLEIVIGQIGGVRVPVREKEITDALDVIRSNLLVLKESIETAKSAKKDGEEPEPEETETPERAEVRDSV